MTKDKTLREHVLYLLGGEGAHLGLEEAIAGLPADLRGGKPEGVTHTPWRLLEHMRIAQWDILEFCRDPEHVSPDFPAGFWPSGDAPPDAEVWEGSVAGFRTDLTAMQNLVMETEEILGPIPHGDGQTLLREALLVADHNAYHLGQMVMICRLLGDRQNN